MLFINLMTAKRIGWLVETASNVFHVGPNLLMELPYGKTSVKPDPATCLNFKRSPMKVCGLGSGNDSRV